MDAYRSARMSDQDRERNEKHMGSFSLKFETNQIMSPQQSGSGWCPLCGFHVLCTSTEGPRVGLWHWSEDTQGFRSLSRWVLGGTSRSLPWGPCRRSCHGKAGSDLASFAGWRVPCTSDGKPEIQTTALLLPWDLVHIPTLSVLQAAHGCDPDDQCGR